MGAHVYTYIRGYAHIYAHISKHASQQPLRQTAIGKNSGVCLFVYVLGHIGNSKQKIFFREKEPFWMHMKPSERHLKNVFFGDMSVVGPRPHPINLNKEYRSKVTNFEKRHRYKPGITGLAQSLGHSGFVSSFHDMNHRIKMDIFYFKNWSMFLDLKIIIRTILILFKGVLKLR